MFSFTELHTKLLELQSVIRKQDYSKIPKYLEELEQIDKILISLDILAQTQQNN